MYGTLSEGQSDLSLYELRESYPSLKNLTKAQKTDLAATIMAIMMAEKPNETISATNRDNIFLIIEESQDEEMLRLSLLSLKDNLASGGYPSTALVLGEALTGIWSPSKGKAQMIFYGLMMAAGVAIALS